MAKKPSHTELVEIFLSKLFWHSHVVKPFAIVARYPQMVAWLEREDGDCPSDFKVWHLQKSEYGFKELKQWLGNDGTLDKAAKGRMEKAKGKGKGKKGKGKKREEDQKEMEVDDGKGKASSSNIKTHKRK